MDTGSRTANATFGKLRLRLENQRRLTEISRLTEPPEREFFEAFASVGLPCALEGFIPSRLTNAQETIRILRASMGAHVATVRFGNYADPRNYIKHRRKRRLTIADYLDTLQAGRATEEHVYLANEGVPGGAVKALELRRPPYYKVSDLRAPRMWLGPKGCITPLHKDGSDNFSLQIFGSKKWFLFPVKDYPFLYLSEPEPRTLPGFACSEVDLSNPDYERFPLFRRAIPVVVEIDAGETLYLPAGWAHYAETLSTALTINYWVDNRRRLPASLEPLSP